MEYAVVTAPAAPVRRKPRHSSEMVNQLLFGETVQLRKTKGELWVKIRGQHDDYEGWMTRTMLEPVDEAGANAMSAYATRDLLGVVHMDNKKVHVPFGSSLPFFQEGKGKIGGIEYTFSGHLIKRDEQQLSIALLTQLTQPWLNAPYLWGGRTPLGVDCSGFVQIIYKMMGMDLPRDAWQQAQEGTPVKKFAQAQPGDLLFFDDKEEIVHVGMLISEGHMIHASGKVKIDEITKKGVYNAEGKRVLRLEAIRRL